MPTIYVDSFTRSWTTERLLLTFPGMTRVAAWETGSALFNSSPQEHRLQFGANILGPSYTSTEWAFGFTLKLEGTALPLGSGTSFPAGESRIIQIGTHVGIRLLPALTGTPFLTYSLGMFVVNGALLSDAASFADAQLLVGKTYHIQVKITVGAAGSVVLAIHNELGQQVYTKTVSPMVSQGAPVFNGFAFLYVLQGMTIGHLVVGTNNLGLAVTVPLAPNDVGSISQWAPFPAPPNWDAVDKDTFDQETYVQSSVVNNQDLYATTDPPTLPATAQVPAIMVGLVARAEFEGSAPKITAVWSNVPQSATVHEIFPAGKVVGPILTEHVFVLEQNPNTVAAFVASELTSSQIGVKLL